MSVSLWQSPQPGESTRVDVDVAIIGAGLIGSYLALRLSAQAKRILVLERNHVASGASGRNGGLLLSGIAHSYFSAHERYGREAARELWALTVQNREAMIALATRFNTPVRRCGSYLFACTTAQSAELRESAAMMQADGLEVVWHADDPLRRGFRGAIENVNDGAIQAALLTAAILRASGAALRETSEVYGIAPADDGVHIHARGGEVVAKQVFVATNAWTPLLLPEFVDMIVPGRGQVIATAPTPSIIDRSGYCDDGFEYFQQLPDGRFVLGGFRHLAFEDETTYADATTPQIQNALAGFIAQYFPELVDVPIERRWSGTMAFTPDGLPLVGRLRRDERIAFAAGFNGHGLGLGIVAVDQLLDTPAGGAETIFGARRLMGGAV